MKKKLVISLLLLIISTYTPKSYGDIDPLSKIVITSNKAVCQKDKNRINLFVFTYIENVNVSFADGSKIRSGELQIELDTSKIKNEMQNNITNTNEQQPPQLTPTTKNNLSQFKKITFKNNVFITQENRTIQADKAELYLSDKKCKLLGNVRIKQIKKHAKDLPITTNCNKALLDMQTEQVTLLGDMQAPVNTTITLAGHPGLLKKVKTKKEKKTERKALQKQHKRDKKKK